MPPTDPLSQFFVTPDTTWTPRVLKDGADSVGALGALNRVYINIGVFSEEWLLHFRALLGGEPISPIPIETAQKNSVYWRATEMQSPNMARYLLAGTRSALPEGRAGWQRLSHRRRRRPSSAARSSLPSAARDATRASCRRCRPASISRTPTGRVISPRGTPTGIGRRPKAFKTPMRQTGCSRTISSTATISPPSCACRSPLLGINACSPLATNAIRGNIWDNFASESYKTLPSAGTITIRHPMTGKEMDYPLPAGGRGYIRPASLVSVWSTAPFLQNNTVGPFEWSPSVEARMRSFEQVDRADAVARTTRDRIRCSARRRGQASA